MATRVRVRTLHDAGKLSDNNVNRYYLENLKRACPSIHPNGAESRNERLQSRLKSDGALIAT